MTQLSHVGKYQVVELLGEGAMGVVYLALDPVLNRHVAIKVMGEALARDDEFRDRFMREARAAGSLQHPNVVTIYDCGEVDGHLYIAMEFLRGADLEFLLRSDAPMTVVAKLDIMIDVLHGLAFAHKRGIIHRDVKPANIRISEDGRALIMDFGIAHLASSNITRTGLIVGTPNYMAPEQISGGAITQQTDIFAVGVVLYEVLTHHKPFESGSLQTVMYKIVSQPPDPVEHHVPNVRPELAAVVMKALAKEPGDRHATATELANDLIKVRALISGSTTTTSKVSLRDSIKTVLADIATFTPPEISVGARRMTSPPRRRWVGTFAAAAVLLLLIVAALARGRSAARPKDEVAKIAAVATPSGASAPVTASATEDSRAAQRTTMPPVAAPTSSAPTLSRAETPSKPENAAEAMTLLPSARAVALRARRRASDAGATDGQLRAGDMHNRAAESAVKNRMPTSALAHFDDAAIAWTDAERAVRASRSIAAAPSVSQPDVTREPVKEPLKEAPRPIPVAAAPPPPVQQASVAPVANPSGEIASLVADYAKALESRDVSALRRVYPDLSASQVRNFEDFFRNIRMLRTTLVLTNLQIDGATAEARLAGAYDFVTSTGQSEHQPVALNAVFRKDSGGWRIASIK